MFHCKLISAGRTESIPVCLVKFPSCDGNLNEGLTASRMVGKWSLPQRSSWTALVNMFTRAGSATEISRAEYVPKAGCKYIFYPSLHMERWWSKSFNILPLALISIEPHNRLCPFKSPMIRKDLGSWTISLSRYKTVEYTENTKW